MPEGPVPVRLDEFQPDTEAIGNGVVVLKSGWEQKLEANKQMFAAEFVQRPRFVAAYPATLTPAEFVDNLFAHAGVTPADNDRAAAIAELGTATTSSDAPSRARALRRVAENSTLTQKEVKCYPCRKVPLNYNRSLHFHLISISLMLVLSRNGAARIERLPSARGPISNLP